MKKLYIIFYLAISYCSLSQPLQMKWLKSCTLPNAILYPEFSAPLPNEGIAVMGWQQRPGLSWSVLFVVALDSSGNVLWRDSIVKVASNDQLYLRGLATTPQGEVIVTGEFSGSLKCQGTVISDSASNHYSTYLARFNNGVLNSFSVPFYSAGAAQLTSDSQGNLLIALQLRGTAHGLGSTWSALNGPDLLVCKISTSNTLLWSKQFSGSVYATLLAVSPTDEIVLFGNCSDTLTVDSLQYPNVHNGPYGCDLFRVFLNQTGNLTNINMSTTGVMMPNQVIFNNDKMILTAGVCGNHECGTGYQEIDSTASSLWYTGTPKNGLGYGDSYAMNHIASVDTGNFWAIGQVLTYYTGYAPPRIHDYVFTNYDYKGNVIRSDSFPMSIINYPFGYGDQLVLSNGSSIYYTGMFRDTLTLYGQSVTDTSPQMFICRLTSTVAAVGIKQIVHEEYIKMYPNPTNGTFIVIGNEEKQSLNICVYDVLGNCVYTSFIKDSTETTIDLSKEASGIYFVKVNSINYSNTLKVVKE